MSEQERLLIRIKAEAFDRVAAKYGTLQGEAGFYSSNWVELSETIEAELRRIRWIAGEKPAED